MFKNLKSLFVNEDEADKVKSPDEAQSAVKETSNTPSSATTAGTNTTTAGPGQVTDQFTQILLGAIEKNNIDGFDYLEFRQSLLSLKKMPMDEATRFKSAYAMAQTMGANPDHLLKTATHYLEILQEEEGKFQDALQNQRTRQIGDKEQQLQQLDKLIHEKADQIQRLSKEIEEHQAQIQTIKNDLTESTVKVESTRNDFVASYHSIVEQIRKDIENMEKYPK